MRKFLILSLLFLSLSSKGFSFNGGFASGFSGCSSFDLSAEWLYMLSSLDQPFFATENSDADIPFGKRFANEQRWHSGYRIEGRYFYPCGEGDYLRARFTHIPCFENRRRLNFTGEFGAILSNPDDAISGPGNARIRHRLDFKDLEFLWGRTFYCCRRVSLDLEVGFEWARINWHERVRYNAVTEDILLKIKNKSTFNGFGPEIVLDLAYCLCDCFSIVSRSTFALLVNRRTARYDENRSEGGTTTPPFSADNDKFWFGTPFFDARFGLNYHSSLSFCGCQSWRYNIEFGYEIIHLTKAVDRIYFVDVNNTASSIVQHQDFTLHGPYLHVGFSF